MSAMFWSKCLVWQSTRRILGWVTILISPETMNVGGHVIDQGCCSRN